MKSLWKDIYDKNQTTSNIKSGMYSYKVDTFWRYIPFYKKTNPELSIFVWNKMFKQN